MNNTNPTDPFSCDDPSVVSYRYFAVFWGCVVTIIGTVGNIMTILAFASDPRLRTRFNVLIINLAAADLLYCTILQPISVDSYLHLRWRSGQLWCKLFGLLLFLSNSISIITLCLVAVSRYVLVARRAVFDRVFSNLGLFLLLLSTWILGLASFAPVWSLYVFVPHVCTCSFDRSKGHPYITTLLFSYFFLGLGCVGVFYMLIYRRVKTASKALLRYRIRRRTSRRNPFATGQATDDSGVESTMNQSCSGEISSQADTAQNKDEVKSSQSAQHTDAPNHNPTSKSIVPKSFSTTPATSDHTKSSGDDGEFKRVTRMCLTVFLCFVCCFVPFILLNIAEKHIHAPRVLHMFCANLTWLNSCINPVLYAVMNRQFRQAYHLLLSRAATPFTRLWAQCRAQRSRLS